MHPLLFPVNLWAYSIFMSKLLCEYCFPFCVNFCINIYCIWMYCQLVSYVNPANDNIWNTCFHYCHGPRYDHHLYVQILWNVLNKDELINTWFISDNNNMFRNSKRMISGRRALLGLCWLVQVDLWKIWSFDFRMMKKWVIDELDNIIKLDILPKLQGCEIICEEKSLK